MYLDGCHVVYSVFYNLSSKINIYNMKKIIQSSFEMFPQIFTQSFKEAWFLTS